MAAIVSLDLLNCVQKPYTPCSMYRQQPTSSYVTDVLLLSMEAHISLSQLVSKVASALPSTWSTPVHFDTYRTELQFSICS